MQTGWTGSAGPCTNEDAWECAELAEHHYPNSLDTSLWPSAQHNLCGFTMPLLWHHDVLLVEGAMLLPSLTPTHWARRSATTDPTRWLPGSSPASGATNIHLLESPNILQRHIQNASKHTHPVVTTITMLQFRFTYAEHSF